MRAGSSRYYAENASVLRVKRKKQYEANRVDVLARQAKSRLARKDSIREYQRRYAALNKGKKAAHCAKRHAAKLRATPPWADLAAIERVYALAAEMTRQTGELHHVDHIAPLQGDIVCGLHVAENLRVITALENIRKHNRFE